MLSEKFSWLFHIAPVLVLWHNIPGQSRSFSSARAEQMFGNKPGLEEKEEEELGDTVI
jgi:hypothetical protein